MSSPLKLLCRCDDPSEAEAIRMRLEAAGFPALISGIDSIHVGLEAGPKVEVAEEHFDRAMQILVSDLHNTQQAEPWQCDGCAEPNDAAFELCWNCQQPRDDLDQPRIESLPPPTAQLARIQATADDGNPYRSVMIEDDRRTNSQLRLKRWYPLITVSFAALLSYFLLAVLIR